MARNRRNIRKKRSITDYLNMKTFIIIIAILTTIISICFGINEYKRYTDRQLLSKQKEEMDKQNEQIFTAINSNISEANQTISKQDVIIKMSAVGDILCGEAMLSDAYNQEHDYYNFNHMFNNISSYINKADIVMGTMETNFTSGKYTNENAPREFAKAVKNSGVNLVTICHNHSLDLGLQGLKDTKQTLKNLGYSVFGDKLENDNAVLIKQVKNTKIAFLTYTYGISGQASKESLKYADKLIKEYKEIGFIYIEDCIKSLEKYYLNRNNYKNFEEYFPQILEDIKTSKY